MSVWHAPACAAPDAIQADEPGTYRGSALVAACAPLCLYADNRRAGMEPADAAWQAFVDLDDSVLAPFVRTTHPVDCPACIEWLAS